MKFYRLLFALFVALLMVVILLWLVHEPAGSTGMAHPDFGAMKHSGPDITSAPSIQWLAIGFGGLIVLILITCVILGYLRHDKLEADRNILIWIGAIYVAVYAGMIITYLDYIRDTDTLYFLGFPLPTAWMIYFFWLFPVAFTIYYVKKFDKWVFEPSSLEVFKSLISSGSEENNSFGGTSEEVSKDKGD